MQESKRIFQRKTAIICEQVGKHIEHLIKFLGFAKHPTKFFKQ